MRGRSIGDMTRQKNEHKEPCEDAISRSELLDTLNDKFPGIADINDVIINMPSVQPARAKAKWAEYGHKLSDSWIAEGWQCPSCKCHTLYDAHDREMRTRYCPDCGAEMEDDNANSNYYSD